MGHNPLSLSNNGDDPGLPTWSLSNKGFNSQLWGELRRVVAQKGLQSVTLSPWVLLTRLLFPSLLFCGRLYFSVGVEYSIWWKGSLEVDLSDIVSLAKGWLSEARVSSSILGHEKPHP